MLDLPHAVGALDVSMLLGASGVSAAKLKIPGVGAAAAAAAEDTVV